MTKYTNQGSIPILTETQILFIIQHMSDEKELNPNQQDEEDDSEEHECGHTKQIEDLGNEVKILRNKNLELLSEMDNLRKRHISDMQEASKYSNTKFALDILPIVDNIEMAMNAAKSNPQIYEGIQMAYTNMLKQLKKHNITPMEIKPHDAYNSTMHSVLSQVSNDEFEDNTIIQVPISGYMMFDRVLRPAQVIVSKKVED
jgi:molecular chaperone GrpE